MRYILFKIFNKKFKYLILKTKIHNFKYSCLSFASKYVCSRQLGVLSLKKPINFLNDRAYLEKNNN